MTMRVKNLHDIYVTAISSITCTLLNIIMITLIIILVIMVSMTILHQAYKELGLLMVLLFVCILTFARFQSSSSE